MLRSQSRRLALLAVVSMLVLACGGPAEPPPPPPGESPGAPSAPALQSPSAGGELPPGHPPVESPPAGSLAAPPQGSGTGEAALSWNVPDGWESVPPASPMRRAEYRVPGPGGDAECVVFYFGPGQGGGAMANAERWASQFQQPDGSSSLDAMKTRETKQGDSNVLMVEVTGTYMGGQSMSMKPTEPQPNAMLLGAIAEGPDANWFFKFTGPEATVAAQREAFKSMVASLRSGE